MNRRNSLVLIIICVSLLISMASGLGVDIGPDQAVRFGDTAPFRVSVSDYAGGTLVYTWTFGDGTTMSGSSITPEFLTIHRYTHEGTYTAHLSVKSEDGSGATDTATITVANVKGSIVGWGWDGNGQATPPIGNDYVAIAAGSAHSLVMKSDGSIVGWGYNEYGQATPPAGNDYVAIAAGGYHSLALKSDGSIVGWGYNRWGQATPPAGNDYVAIAAGGWHSLALKSDGSIEGWGWDEYGQATPPAGNDYVAIAAGGQHNLALKSDGSIVGWGEDATGQATPPAGNDYVAIAAGWWHSLALKSDGSILGWGHNVYGQATPPAGNDYVAIAAGWYHSLALTTNQPPVANAGPDQTVKVNSPINLDGSLSSDPDNDPLTYKWSVLTRPAGSTAVLSDTTAQKPAFTADRIGDYTIQLIVNDGQVDSAPATVTLHATQIAVPVDIEPGICPNIIALNFKGPHLFIAIPGTENLDAKKIDPASITLSREGISEEVEPLSSNLVIIPYLVTSSCNCQNSVRDYTQDLVLVFDAGEVVTQLQLQEVVGETVPFTVQGTLKAEYGTTPITGSDCVKVLPEYGLNLFFVATCPVDLIITDPDGLEMSKISHEIPSAQYFEADINDDGSPDDIIFIGERKIGDYSVQVIPDFNANPTDTYSLTAGSGQSEVILADNVAITAIPYTPYTIQVAQNGEINVPAKVRIVPKSLNIAGKGKFVAFISLPNNYKATDVDAKSVKCEGAPALRLIRIKAFPNKFAAIFNREKLVNVKPWDKVKVTVIGTINKNGQKIGFRGSDEIKVISKKGTIKEPIDDVDTLTDEKVFSQFNPQ